MGNVLKAYAARGLTEEAGATGGTLLTFGGTRLDVKRRRSLWFYSRIGPGFQILGYPATYDCDTPSGCSGWDTFYVYDSRVVVVNNDFNTDVIAYERPAGARAILCPGVVVARVITDTAKLACGQYHGGPQDFDIVSGASSSTPGPASTLAP